MENSTTYEILESNFELVPLGLRRLNQWVAWRYEDNGRPKLDKVPYSAKTGTRAASNNPATWATFDEAIAALSNGGAYDGIGICNAEGDGLVQIDLDNVRDPATGYIDARAVEILQRFGWTYQELSPSGTGFHIYCYGRIARSGKGTFWKDVEAYCHPSNRYLTVTGAHWNNTPLELTEQQDALDWLFEMYLKPRPKAEPKPAKKDTAPPAEDAELIAGVAKHSDKFKALLRGEWEAQGFASQSEADLSFCSILAGFTQDAEQIDGIYRGSGLYQLPGRAKKWDTVHCEGRTYGEATISKSLADSVAEDAPQSTETKPVIMLRAGHLTEIIDAAERALLQGDVPLFQQVGQLVRPVVLQAELEVYSKASIAPGSLVIEPATEAWLTEAMDRSAIWQRYDGRAKKKIASDCPRKIATHYLSRKGEWRLPVLMGIIEAPLLRADGTLLDAPGYDPGSGLYLHYCGQPFTVPERPGRTEALLALEVLKDPLSEFKFVDPVDLSVALSGILTAIQRRVLRSAPFHAITAPIAGSGKSLLADVIGLIATGRRATVINCGADQAEDEKRIGALLLRGCSIINIDNVERRLEGEFLCSLATAELVETRILGTSITGKIRPSCTTILATGNNLEFRGDITRRVIQCRIDPVCERPDARKFQRNLEDYLPHHRGELLQAALTILRAYRLAGSPSQGLDPYGSFTQWDREIRAPLVWLGCGDPLASREKITQTDPVAQGLKALLGAWYTVMGTRKATTQELINAATPRVHFGGPPEYDVPGGEFLRACLLEVAGSPDGNAINPRTLGRYLSKYRGRVAGGYRLEEIGISHSARVFALELVG